MIGIPLGLAAANVSEWWIHKHVLHGKDHRPDRFWGFHLYEHHAAALKNGGYDAAYEKPWWSTGPRRREVLGITMMVLPFVPLAPLHPFLTATVTWSAYDYYRKHKRAHLDPAWSREHLPWHYDHHMGPDQHANWGVTRPYVDKLLGTRKPYLGTADEARDNARKAKIRASARDT